MIPTLAPAACLASAWQVAPDLPLRLVVASSLMGLAGWSDAKRYFPGKRSFFWLNLVLALWIALTTAEHAAVEVVCKTSIALLAWPLILLQPVLWALFLYQYVNSHTQGAAGARVGRGGAAVRGGDRRGAQQRPAWALLWRRHSARPADQRPAAHGVRLRAALLPGRGVGLRLAGDGQRDHRACDPGLRAGRPSAVAHVPGDDGGALGCQPGLRALRRAPARRRPHALELRGGGGGFRLADPQQQPAARGADVAPAALHRAARPGAGARFAQTA